MTDIRRGGRPRSNQAHAAILEATRNLLSAKGYENLTIEAIAAEAGVGRQTIYRWWSSKAAVVTEAVTTGIVDARAAAPANTGDIRADMRAWWAEYLQVVDDPTLAPLLRGLTVAAAEHTEDADRLHTGIVAPVRRMLVERMHIAVEAGQLRDDTDLPLIAETLIAHTLYQLITHRPNNHSTGLIDLLLRPPP